MTDRRKFLTGVIATSAATAVTPALPATPPAAPERVPSALPPNAQVAAAETGSPVENGERSRIGGVPGSDFMVDVIKTLDIKYLPRELRLELPRRFTSRSSTTAATRCRNSSLHARGIRGRHGATATSRSPASR